MDLGECPKLHDLALRADYEAASKTREYGYELDVSIPFHLLYTLNKHGRVSLSRVGIILMLCEKT